MSTAFSPLSALIGGALIGVSAVMLLLIQGKVAGISGIASRLLPPYSDTAFAQRLAFIAGLVVAPLMVMLITGRWPAMTLAAGWGTLIIAGLLVGFGSVYGNGCTSGHGVCGLSRLSVRSLVAVGMFMATAMITVFVARHTI